ncbi:hypothetical protein Ahu01nite_092000 [Winogradskya humida]|uniref:Uncharacterized protein n=1 Tax=Winogradskya humida TaxID=113566 RepID=A0ABQ4A5I5_9ACTN|nr:hypothetical protein Ahu01nite_092000 [Actinoplanes humidus]
MHRTADEALELEDTAAGSTMWRTWTGHRSSMSQPADTLFWDLGDLVFDVAEEEAGGRFELG